MSEESPPNLRCILDKGKCPHFASCHLMQCSVVQCSVVQCSVVWCSVVQCSVVRRLWRDSHNRYIRQGLGMYTTLHYTTLHYTTLHYTTLHYTTLHHTTLHYTTLHYTTLHYITLHYNASHKLNKFSIVIICCRCNFMKIAKLIFFQKIEGRKT